MSDKILLTGFTGFIGSHVRLALQKEDFHVLLLTRTSGRNPLTDNEKIIVGKFYDYKFLNSINEPIDTIIHCAAIRGESNALYSDYNKVNVTGTEFLLKFAKENKISRFIYISSVGVLGTIPNVLPASNCSQVNPDGKYHQSKWKAEELVRAYTSNDLRTIILRPTVTYGPGDDGFIKKLTILVKKKQFIFPKNDTFIHLLDVNAFSKLIVNIIKRDLFNGKTYIIADEKKIMLKTLVDLISNNTHNKAYPQYYQFPMFVFSIMKYILDILNNSQLLTSIKLISENWTYDINDTISTLNYHPKDTFRTMEQYKIIKMKRANI